MSNREAADEIRNAILNFEVKRESLNKKQQIRYVESIFKCVMKYPHLIAQNPKFRRSVQHKVY